MWIGTFNGLNRYNASSQTFTNYQKQNKERSLTHSSIWALLCDKQGSIWIGTYFVGVNYFHPENQVYRHYQISFREGEGLSSPIVGSITEDSQQNLWISTEGGGINKYDPKSDKFQWYKHTEHSNSISHDNVKAIYYDKNKEALWIGTHMGGLNKLNIQNERFTYYPFENTQSESSLSRTIRDIIPYKDKLILATHGGISIFNTKTGQYKPLFQDKSNMEKPESVMNSSLSGESSHTSYT